MGAGCKWYLPIDPADFVSSDYLVGGHFTRIQVQSQTPEHGLTLNSDSYLLAGQMFAAPRSLQSQKLTWASGAFEYETAHSTDSTRGRNETKPDILTRTSHNY